MLGHVGDSAKRPHGGVEAQADIQPSGEDVVDYCSDPTNEPGWNLKMTTVEQLTTAHRRGHSRPDGVQLGAEGVSARLEGFGIGRWIQTISEVELASCSGAGHRRGTR